MHRFRTKPALIIILAYGVCCLAQQRPDDCALKRRLLGPTVVCGPVTRAGAPAEPSYVVATTARRIEPREGKSRVYAGKRQLELGNFLELLVVIPTPGKGPPQALLGKKLALVKSLGTEQWELYANVGWGVLDLPENVFTVKQVFAPNSTSPITVRWNGQSYRLKSQEVLILLG